MKYKYIFCFLLILLTVFYQGCNTKDRVLYTELFNAVYDDDVDKVATLLSENPEIDLHVYDINGLTPLQWACSRLNEDNVKLLLEYGSDPNTESLVGGNTLNFVNYGVPSEAEAIVKMLIENNAEVNVKEKKEGFTPIMRAASGGDPNINIVKLLIDAGAKVDIKDNRGKTALDWAEEAGVNSQKILEMLKKSAIIEHGKSL